MAFFLLQSCDLRAMTPRSTLMWHEPGLYGSHPGGQKGDFRRYADFLEVASKAMNRHVAASLALPYEEICKKVDGRDWWMEMVEAKQVGAIDLVVDSVPLFEEVVRLGLSEP